MRKISAVIAGTFIVVLAAAPAQAKTNTQHQTSRQAYAQWVSTQELPGAQRITTWFVGAAVGSHGSSSDFFYERDLCVADQACVVEDFRSGYIEHLSARSFRIDANANRAKLNATYDVYLIGPTGDRVGPATAMHVVADWTATGSPERSNFSSSSERRCATYRESGADVSRAARAFATVDATKLGKATDARIGRSSYSSYEQTCEG